MTYNLVAVPVLVVLGIHLNNRKEKDKRSLLDFSSFSLATLPYFVGVLLFLIVLSIYQMIDFKEGVWVQSRDYTYLFYIRISDYLFITGEENISGGANLINSKYNGSTLYHYFDLWLAAFYTKVFATISAFSFRLGVHNTLLVILYAGYCAVASLFVKQLKFYHYLFIIPFLYSSTIYSNLLLSFDKVFPHYEIFHYIYGNEGVAYFRHKVTIVDCLVLATILLFAHQHYKIAFLMLIYFAGCYVILAPAIYSSVFLFSSFYFYRSNYQDKEWLYIVLCSVIDFLLIIGLSKFNAPYINQFIDLSIFLDRMSFIHFIQVFISFLTQQLFLYLPFSIAAIIYLYRYRKLIDVRFNFFLVSFLISVFFGSLVDDFNWEQFYEGWSYSLGKIALSFIVFIASMTIIEQRKSQSIKLLVVASFTLLATSWLYFRTFRNMQLHVHAAELSYDKTFLQQLNNIITENDNQGVIGLFVMNPERFHEMTRLSSKGHSHTNMIDLGALLAGLRNGVDFFNVSWLDVQPQEQDYLTKEYITNSVLMQFIVSQKEKGTFVSIEASKADFVKAYAIKYLILEENTSVPDSLEPLVEKVLVDNKTKTKFVLLNPLK